jgi:hypothetical protein
MLFCFPVDLPMLGTSRMLIHLFGMQGCLHGVPIPPTVLLQPRFPSLDIVDDEVADESAHHTQRCLIATFNLSLVESLQWKFQGSAVAKESLLWCGQTGFGKCFLVWCAISSID